MMSLLALHAVAAGRGDGLHPELARLLERRGRPARDGTPSGRLEHNDGVTPRASAASRVRRGRAVP